MREDKVRNKFKRKEVCEKAIPLLGSIVHKVGHMDSGLDIEYQLGG